MAIVFAAMKYLFSRLGHSMTVLTPGRPAHLLVTDQTVEMVGTFEAGFVNMVEQGIVPFVQILFTETVTAVTFPAGDSIGLTAFGMTADAVGIGHLPTCGVMMALHAGGYFGVHGVIEVNSTVESGQTVDLDCFRCIFSLHGSAWFRPEQYAPNGQGQGDVEHFFLCSHTFSFPSLFDFIDSSISFCFR
jgi:hypothetical protein